MLCNAAYLFLTTTKNQLINHAVLPIMDNPVNKILYKWKINHLMDANQGRKLKRIWGKNALQI